MTGRERLLAVLRGEMPDCVPVCLCGLPGFNAKHWANQEPSYARLMDAVRARADELRSWEPEPLLAGGLGWLRTATRETTAERAVSQEGEHERTVLTIHTPKGDLVRRMRRKPEMKTTWVDEPFVKTGEDIERVLSVPYEPIRFDCSSYAAAEAEVGGHGLVQPPAVDALCIVAELFEFGEFTVRALTERETVRRLLDAFHERVMDRLRAQLEAGAGIGTVWRVIGAEYATPPYLPPELFHEYVVPYDREMIELIHAHGAYARIHCHGKVARVLDLLVETGADAVDPVEPPPQGDIELAEAKQRLAGRMAIFGNVEFSFLETASPEEVRAEIARCMEAAKPGGRYAVMPTAGPIDVPLRQETEENFIALLDAVREYGAY